MEKRSKREGEKLQIKAHAATRINEKLSNANNGKNKIR